MITFAEIGAHRRCGDFTFELRISLVCLIQHQPDVWLSVSEGREHASEESTHTIGEVLHVVVGDVKREELTDLPPFHSSRLEIFTNSVKSHVMCTSLYPSLLFSHRIPYKHITLLPPLRPSREEKRATLSPQEEGSNCRPSSPFNDIYSQRQRHSLPSSVTSRTKDVPTFAKERLTLFSVTIPGGISPLVLPFHDGMSLMHVLHQPPPLLLSYAAD
jgi:hypothetical protein